LSLPLVIFSHGFGVQRDDRGLFSDIASVYPALSHVMFDYNDVEQGGMTLTVRPFSKQAEILSNEIKKVCVDNPQTPVHLICHSQGCFIAALVSCSLPMNVSKVIFITPPAEMDIQRMLLRMKDRPGCLYDRNGVSRLARRDASSTLVPKAFLDEMEAAKDVKSCYAALAQKTKLHIIKANHDEVLGETDFSYLENKAFLTCLDGNHDFTDSYRSTLLDFLKASVSSSSAL